MNLNIRCKCHWCEHWHERENETLEQWSQIMYGYKEKDSEGYRHVNDEWLKESWDNSQKCYSSVNKERSVYETYSKEELLKMCNELLECSGGFDESTQMHSLCLAVKELLK